MTQKYKTKNNIDIRVGNKIRILRKKYKKSQKEIGDLLNISQQQMVKYENGISSINIEKLMELLLYFKSLGAEIDLNYFMTN